MCFLQNRFTGSLGYYNSTKAKNQVLFLFRIIPKRQICHLLSIVYIFHLRLRINRALIFRVPFGKTVVEPFIFYTFNYLSALKECFRHIITKQSARVTERKQEKNLLGEISFSLLTNTGFVGILFTEAQYIVFQNYVNPYIF